MQEIEEQKTTVTNPKKYIYDRRQYARNYYRQNVEKYKKEYKYEKKLWVCEICDDKKVLKSPRSMHNTTKKHRNKLVQIQMQQTIEKYEQQMNGIKSLL